MEFMPGAAPGHGVSQNVGKTNPHQPSGRFRKAPGVARECLNAGQPQTVGDVCLPKVLVQVSRSCQQDHAEIVPRFFRHVRRVKESKKHFLQSLGRSAFPCGLEATLRFMSLRQLQKRNASGYQSSMTPTPGDWLRKTFNGDVVDCATRILEGPVSVKWGPLEQAAFEVKVPTDGMKEADAARISSEPIRSKVQGARGALRNHLMKKRTSQSPGNVLRN